MAEDLPLGARRRAGDHAALVMRRAALLLLLLVLPGLLVPAGAWWHVCRCVVPMHTQSATCCAPTDAADAAPSCCSNAATPDHAALPTLADDDCRCDWLALPDLGDDGAAPPAATDAPMLAPPPRRLVVVATAPATPPSANAWRARHQRPPPDPFAARNLPLRI